MYKERQFVKAISSEPYYRIFAVPRMLNPDAVSTREQEIHDILRNPPNVRKTEFGFIGVQSLTSSSEGITGPDVWGYKVVIFKNGFFELRRPLSSTQFQHRMQWLAAPNPLTYQKPGPRKPHRLDPDELATHVKAVPDATQKERAAHFGVSQQCVWYGLKKIGCSRKKNAYL